MMWSQAVLLSTLATVVHGNYVITAPRVWSYQEATRVCLYHVGVHGQDEDVLKLIIEDRNNETIISKDLPVHKGQISKCYRVQLPVRDFSSNFGDKIIFEGRLGEKRFLESRDVQLVVPVTRTFVQTDKYLYRPGQTVRFRILTVFGPNVEVSTDDYPIVHVENPSGTRILQWLNVDNSKGLVHLQFNLPEDNIVEGVYTIRVKKMNNDETRVAFRVEEYTLPRFEVIVEAPGVILGTDSSGRVRVCARYTFGQPVVGRACVVFGERNCRHQVTRCKETDACQDFEFSFEELDINGRFPLNQVAVVATVEEKGTGTKLNSSRTYVEIKRRALTFTPQLQTFVRPVLPLTVKVQVFKANGFGAFLEPMQVCLGKLCNIFKTDAIGILGFHVPPSALGSSPANFTNTLQVKALNYPEIKRGSPLYSSIMHESAMDINIEPYFSPSNSSLQLMVPKEKLDCMGQKVLLDLAFSVKQQESALITVQVIARGQIRFQETREYFFIGSPLSFDFPFLTEMIIPDDVVVGTLKIPVSLREMDSPEAKVLVWYSREDGEVVSDVATLNIHECLPNQVVMKWDAETVEPGKRATLTLEGEPNSLCSIGVVDKSVELLSSSTNQITPDRIFDAIRNSLIQRLPPPQSQDLIYCQKVPGPVEEERLAFPHIILNRDSSYYTIHRDALSVFDDSGLIVITDLTIETRPCFEQKSCDLFQPLFFQSSDIAFADVASSRLEGGRQEEESVRTFFPETWLWMLHFLETGQSEQNLVLPDTVTEWVGRVVCVHQEKSVGVSEKSSITTFKPFFMDLTLPPSVKRGEILPVKISVFNYLNHSIPVKVVLEESLDFKILDDETVNPGEWSACVAPSKMVTRTIRISPMEIGNVNISVKAFEDDSLTDRCGFLDPDKRDFLVKPIMVEADGFPRQKTWTEFICSEDKNGMDSAVMLPLELPNPIIEGSENAFVITAGDLLGPSLENLENLIQLPYGCGEQNMVRFAPNIYILQYLEASNQLTKEIAQRGEAFLLKGYQRELTFRHNNGSYSAFGPSDESGSTWLTAFVVKSFAQARQYIFIDENDLNVSKVWLKQQQMENGCFRSVGRVLHRGLKGGVGKEDSAAPLTAYILVALLEAGESASNKNVSQAIDCLLERQQDLSIYTRAIMSYGLALSRKDARKTIDNLLKEAKHEDGSLYWESPPGTGKGISVETAGYVLLAMVTLDLDLYEDEALKIVTWISRTRNGQGGFVSTQDTVVALQSLAAFSSARPQSNSQLTVTVNARDLKYNFIINDKNRILQQLVALPTLPTNVTLDLTGKGCALLQAVLEYNVPDPNPNEAFSLDVDSEIVTDKTRIINVCVSYLIEGETSNMAVLQVNLVSGYVPVREDLQKVVQDHQLFKKYEVDGSKILFYIDELSNKELCARFQVKREINVENPKPGRVRIYDYYQPEFYVDKSYVL